MTASRAAQHYPECWSGISRNDGSAIDGMRTMILIGSRLARPFLMGRSINVLIDQCPPLFLVCVAFQRIHTCASIRSSIGCRCFAVPYGSRNSFLSFNANQGSLDVAVL
jgi:hypothetical protein